MVTENALIISSAVVGGRNDKFASCLIYLSLDSTNLSLLLKLLIKPEGIWQDSVLTPCLKAVEIILKT